MKLGRKIRDLRLRRGLTVLQLASASGLSKGFISQLENDVAAPSLQSLDELARALGTSVAYLVAADSPGMSVVRRGERRKVRLAGDAGLGECLTPATERNLDVVMAELPPGLSVGEARHCHHGEQCLVCLEGRVRVTCAGMVTELEPGDAAHFDGRTPHALENPGDRVARLLIVITPAAYESMDRADDPRPLRGGRAVHATADPSRPGGGGERPEPDQV